MTEHRNSRNNARAATVGGGQVTETYGSDSRAPAATAAATSPVAANSPRPGRASSAGSARDASSDSTPVVYDGNDAQCSLCLENFADGERVCRLACRHMFHKTCWELFSSSTRTIVDPVNGHTPVEMPDSCPNCRGAGTMIAVWNYIDASRVTQVINGQQVPNDLETTADMYHIGTPMAVPTPPSPLPSYNSHRGPVFLSMSPSYPIQTSLADGRPSIIIDPGSVGNLCGDKWAKDVARLAVQNGHKPSYEKMPRPLQVCGVGKGSQECHYQCALPVAVRPDQESSATLGNLQIPAVSNSDLPGLLGLTALRNNRAILDFNTLQLHFCGPGDYKLEKEVPPGTDTYQLEFAPSGHIVLPCCEYQKASTSSQHSLTLLARGDSAERHRDNSSSSQHQSATLPPPPLQPPVLPATYTTYECHSTPPSQAA